MEAGQLWRQYLLAAGANIGIAISGFCMGWTSPVNLKLANITTSPLEDVVTLDQEAWIGSLLTVGAILGPFIGAFVSANIGRKWGLVSSTVPMITGWILIALTANVAMIYAGRVFNGIGLGMIFTICPMYCAEIATDDTRGAIGAFLQIFITSGFLMVYSIGPYVEYETIAYVGIAITGFFAILFIVIMPESPIYYLSKDDADSATDSLCKIRGRSRDAVQAEINKMSVAVTASKEKKGRLTDIFRGGSFKAFYISCALVFFLQISGVNAVLFYLTNIFEEAGASLDSSISTIIVGAVQVGASCVTPFVADRLGRRILMIISAFGTALAHGLLGTYFTLASNNNPIVESIDFLPITALMLYIITYCWGLGGLPYPIMAELLPMELKAIATPIVTAFAWLLSFLVTRYFTTLAEAVGMGATFFIFGSFCVLALFFALFLLPETKGKSYQEIQDMLNGESKQEKP